MSDILLPEGIRARVLSVPDELSQSDSQFHWPFGRLAGRLGQNAVAVGRSLEVNI